MSAEEGKVVQVADVAGYLTPVPGGVGPMTVAMLMHNTVQVSIFIFTNATTKTNKKQKKYK